MANAILAQILLKEAILKRSFIFAMKLYSLVLAQLLLFSFTSSATEIVTIKAGPGVITWHEVEETDLIQVIGVLTPHKLYFELVDGEQLGGQVTTEPSPNVISGVSKVGVMAFSGDSTSLVTLRVSKKANEVSFSQPLAVPSSEVGDWRIALEVSTDMLTWFTVAPGVVSANSPAGFWRIKAEQVTTGE